MKKVFASALLLTIALCLCLGLAACSAKPSGKYVSESGLSLTFTGDDVSGSLGGGLSINGTYRIDGDKIIFTYSIFGSETSYEQSYSKKGDTLIIGGTAYNKAK